MKTLYAAVGAPVVTAKRIGSLVTEYKESMSGRANDLSDKLTTEFRKEYDGWAEEGEKLVDRFKEGEGRSVDIDQIQGHVVKLRDQLEEMLSTWRTSFREQLGEDSDATEAVKETVEVTEDAAEAAEEVESPTKKKETAKKAPAKKETAKKAPAKKAQAAKADTSAEEAVAEEAGAKA